MAFLLSLIFSFIIPSIYADQTTNITDLPASSVTPGIAGAGTGNRQVSFITDMSTGSQYISDEVIVQYNPRKFQNTRVTSAASADSTTRIGARIQEDFSSAGLQGMQVVKIPSNISVNDAIAEYQKNPDVLYAQPNYVYHTTALIPNDPSYSLQWGLHNTGTPGADIDAQDAWGLSTGSNTVTVAVIDTGVDYNHPDLSSNIWTNTGEIPGNGIDDDYNGYIDDVGGWNFYDGNNDPMDGNTNSRTYHGTHCAGILGAVGNNSVGVCGVNWKVKIMPLRTTDATGMSTTTRNILAINYAGANGASVISNSWGGTGYDPALKTAIDNSPAVVVCASGNTNPVGVNIDSTPFYPAAFDSANIISVAATDSNDNLAGFSNYGQVSVDLAGPGVLILSTNLSSDPTISYHYLSGTSMATPHVSGVAALVKSLNPGLTNRQIKSIILNNVDVLPSLSGKVNTSGRLNAYKAVMVAQRMAQPDKIGVFRNGFWILDANGNFQWDGTGPGADIVAGFGMAGDKPVAGNWNHTVSGDKIGVFRNGFWIIDYNGNFQWDDTGPGQDVTATLGQNGDQPVIGDWNGNGDKKIGVFRDGFWILDGNGNFQWDGTASGDDIVAGFGQAADVPVVADWQGTPQDRIGVFRNGFWLIDYNGNFQWDGTGPGADIVTGFGMAGDVPVPKDWNGDGKPEIAVFRPSTGQWIIDYNGNFQWDDTGPGQDLVATLGQNGDVAVAGNWDAASADKFGVFRGGIWILDYNGNFQWDGAPPDSVAGLGTTGDIPVVGDWS